MSASASQRAWRSARLQSVQPCSGSQLTLLPRVTPHTLRRTSISIALPANKFDVKWVMGQVGHADSKMTMDVYAQLGQRVARSHGASFDRLVREARERLIGDCLGTDAETRPLEAFDPALLDSPDSALQSGNQGMARAGLEPATPRFSASRRAACEGRYSALEWGIRATPGGCCTRGCGRIRGGLGLQGRLESQCRAAVRRAGRTASTWPGVPRGGIGACSAGREFGERHEPGGRLRGRRKRGMAVATKTATKVQLLTTQEVADLLRVSTRTVQNWIKRGQVPYLELPGGEYRLPLAGLLDSLRGTFDLAAALADLDAASVGVSEDEIAAALGE
ncbi:MAG: helix-turn-helix domain-containing protein [Thermoleophilaceae bacterium]